MLTTSGAVTVVETLPLRMLLPVANPVTLPASIRFVATIVAKFLLNNLVVKWKGSKCPPTPLRSTPVYLLIFHLGNYFASAEPSCGSAPPPTTSAPRFIYDLLSSFQRFYQGYQGTLVPRYLGTKVPWYHGTLVPRYLGAQVPWYQGTLVPRYFGTRVPWYQGTLVAR